MLALRLGPALRDEVLGREEVRVTLARATLIGACLLLAGCGPAPREPGAVEVTLRSSALPVPEPRAIASPRASTQARVDAAPISWSTDPVSAEKEAKRSRRPLLVFVGASWSTPSLMMERRVFTSPEVRRAARPYLTARVDATDDPAAASDYWLPRLGVSGVPSVVLVDGRTDRRHVIPGLVEPAELAERLNDFLRSSSSGE